MKKTNEKGITLIALIISVIIMLILSAIAITVGVEAYRNAEMRSFVSQMEVIQARVDIIAAEGRTQTFGNFEDGLEGNAIYTSDRMLIRRLIDPGGEIQGDENAFRRFNGEQMRTQLGIEQIPRNEIFLINFDTREVISVTGIERRGQMHHTIYGEDLRGRVNIVAREPNPDVPSIAHSIYVRGLNATIRVMNEGPVNNLVISYRLAGEEWIQVSGRLLIGERISIPITRSGTYEIRATNRDNGRYVIIPGVVINLGNEPRLEGNLIPTRSDIFGAPVGDSEREARNMVQLRRTFRILGVCSKGRDC